LEDSTCKKVTAMISLYIDDRLNVEHKLFIEDHFKICPTCYQKYKEIKNIIENLKLSSEKMLKQVEGIETANLFNIREYERFNNNISAYVDNEMNDDDSIEFRKYLLKSKSARVDLKNAYDLKTKVKSSVTDCIENVDINFSRKIVRMLKEQRVQKRNRMDVFTKVAILLGLFVFATSGMYFFLHSEKAPNPFFKYQKKVIYVKNTPPVFETNRKNF